MPSGEPTGWKSWRTVENRRAALYAVPAPRGTKLEGALELPGRIGPFASKALLVKAMAERYGWYDHCETCVGMLARECGHRQPERDKSRA